MFLMFFILVATNITYGQKKKNKPTISDKIWNTTTKNKINTVPEKWKGESAVYLSKSLNYTYNRPHNSIEYTKIVNHRVKLLDQAAVSEFSEFKYPKDNSYVAYGTSKVTKTITIGVKIIKPDGKEVIVDTDESIEGEDYNKIAIPNLKKGDIIDYFFHTNVILGENDLYHYEPVEILIPDDYPILDYKFVLNTEKDFFITFGTYNNAPSLEKTTPEAGKKRDKKRRYIFNLKDVEKIDSNRWFFPYVELPAYKFQVNFARTGKYEKRAYAFIPEESGMIKDKIIKEDIFNFYEDKFRPVGKLSEVKKFLKDKTFTSNEEKVKAVFYYIRHAYFTNYIEAILAYQSKIMMNSFAYYGKNPIFFQEDQEFIKFFAAFLKDEKIDYDILIGTKRYNGTLEELLLESNIDFLLKVNTETPVLVQSFNHFSNVNLIDPLLENTNAYALKVTDRKYIENIETVKLPSTTDKENNSTNKLNINFTNDFSSINVKKQSYYKGQSKINEQKNRLNFYDYIYEDYKKFKTKPLIDRIKRKKEKAKFKKEFDAVISKSKDDQKENFENIINSEYDIKVKNYNYKINETGRFDKNEAFIFSEEFSIDNDLIKKAGKNYLLEAGKLIGGQVEIKDNERARKNNIYMTYARSFDNNITISIPDGYTAQGLEKFNINIENETGGFNSKAVVKDNMITITTHKYYSNNYEPKENWSKMIDFLDAVYQFTQEKILFKKL